jgi:hypothetical protein
MRRAEAHPPGMSTSLMVDLPGGPLGSPGPDIVPEPVREPATDVPGGPDDPGIGRPSLPEDPPDGPMQLPGDPRDDAPPSMTHGAGFGR